MFNKHLRNKAFRLLLTGMSFTILMRVYSQSSMKQADIEACMMAEYLKMAKSTVVSIHTFTIQGEQIWSRVGSGWIYHPNGLIVTRQSVVQGGDSIEVMFYNGHKESACVLDCDPVTQVALLKIRHPIKTRFSSGKACSLKSHECVILLGNSLGVFPSVTLGHIIEFQDNGNFIFNGSIPPGNTGGPVFNRKGQLVGMLAGRKRLEEYSEPVGVAIPFELIESVLDRFLSYAQTDAGWMGMYVTDIPSGKIKGVKVISIVPDSPADRAAICPGDTVIAVDGRAIGNAFELAEWVKSLSPRKQVTFDILNKNSVVPHMVQVGRIPFQ